MPSRVLTVDLSTRGEEFMSYRAKSRRCHMYSSAQHRRAQGCDFVHGEGFTPGFVEERLLHVTREEGEKMERPPPTPPMRAKYNIDCNVSVSITGRWRVLSGYPRYSCKGSTVGTRTVRIGLTSGGSAYRDALTSTSWECNSHCIYTNLKTAPRALLNDCMNYLRPREHKLVRVAFAVYISLLADTKWSAAAWAVLRKISINVNENFALCDVRMPATCTYSFYCHATGASTACQFTDTHDKSVESLGVTAMAALRSVVRKAYTFACGAYTASPLPAYQCHQRAAFDVKINSYFGDGPSIQRVHRLEFQPSDPVHFDLHGDGLVIDSSTRVVIPKRVNTSSDVAHAVLSALGASCTTQFSCVAGDRLSITVYNTMAALVSILVTGAVHSSMCGQLCIMRIADMVCFSVDVGICAVVCGTPCDIRHAILGLFSSLEQKRTADAMAAMASPPVTATAVTIEVA
jgi:hypothetical protein